MIVLVETKEKKGQPFRIGDITKKDRKISFTANHVLFDSERYFLEDVRPTGLSPVSYLKWINERTDNTSPFYVTSNVSGSATNYFIRKNLLEAFQTAESVFGGAFDSDGFNVSLLERVGNDDGFSIIYGKNLQSISVVENWSNVVTKLYPVGPDGLILPEKFIKSETQYEQPFTKTADFDFETTYKNENGEDVDYSIEEQQDILRKTAKEYIDINCVPLISYVVNSDVNQNLRIGDTIHVKHPFVDIATEVQEYKYNVLKRKIESITFGNYVRDVKKAFDEIKDSIKENDNRVGEAVKILNDQTNLINNLNKNGLVYIDENEILILDKLPKEKAEHVWRFGLGGIGFSTNGYLGPFDYALTQDGKLNVDFIRANSITANKLAADIGSTLDLSSNESIKLMVEPLKDIISDIAPQNPVDGMKWIDTSVYPNIIKIYNNGEWVSASDFNGSLDGIKGEIRELNTSLGLEQGRIEGLIKDSTVIINGEEKTVKETVEKITIDLNGITNTVKTTSGNNLIRDSMGCFNDGSWTGSFNVDSTNETRSRNMYGYALLLNNGSLKQHIQTTNGTYTLSFVYKKLINLARAKVVINGEELALSNNSYTEFKHLLNVTTGNIEIKFITDTDNSCPVINLMLNKGDTPMEWSLNPNETWSDTVQIGRGVRISSSGTDVVFVAEADIIGFKNKQGEYITTFDDEGMVANSIVVKNKATIVNLLIQDINGQTVINRINPEEVEVFENG